jgi:hypothetical protein
MALAKLSVAQQDNLQPLDLQTRRAFCGTACVATGSAGSVACSRPMARSSWATCWVSVVCAVIILSVTRCLAQTSTCQIPTVLNPNFSGTHAAGTLITVASWILPWRTATSCWCQGGNPLLLCAATQVGSLVEELRENLRPGCYSILAASFAVCLPDLAVWQGCCSSNCNSALGLVSALPACLCLGSSLRPGASQ